MNKKIKCLGDKFYSDVLKNCIKARANKEYCTDEQKAKSIKHGHYLENLATQIEVAMGYAFESTTKEEQEEEGFIKAMTAMNKYRQGIYHKGSFLASLSGCKNK